MITINKKSSIFRIIVIALRFFAIPSFSFAFLLASDYYSSPVRTEEVIVIKQPRISGYDDKIFVVGVREMTNGKSYDAEVDSLHAKLMKKGDILIVKYSKYFNYWKSVKFKKDASSTEGFQIYTSLPILFALLFIMPLLSFTTNLIDKIRLRSSVYLGMGLFIGLIEFAAIIAWTGYLVNQ